ncbi:MAG: peroxiredoxin family protein [Pyrinomonadaceae bacterium]|nr:peroxiredoxin family protein [Pyrinomonadaceae bacterium]
MSENFAEVGRKAPDFTLQTEKGEIWRLSDHLGSVVTLLFYPQNETLVCTKQMCSVRDHWNDYVETKSVIAAVSPGNCEEHLNFSAKYNLPLNILADQNRVITRVYGYHWLFPLNFMRTIVVIDARGILRTRQTMLRAFRPSDRQVITEILRARGDALTQKYENLRSERRKFSDV